MILTVPDLLTPQEVVNLRNYFARTGLRDGTGSAGKALGEVKRNVELPLGDREAQVKQLILEACNRSATLAKPFMPRLVSSPILSLYQPGMAYGLHIDSAFGIDPKRTYRTDISCTIFLDDPARYDGGELAISSEYGERTFKLEPGHAVFYPTLFLHQVLPVTRGERRACVFWMESLVRDPGKRQILYELECLSEWIASVEPIDSEHRQKLVKVRENLYRMWLET